MEYPITKEKSPAEKANSEGEVLDKRNFDNLEDSLALSTFFQSPAYRFLISMIVNAGTKRTAASLLDTDAGPKLFNSSFLPPN